MPDRVSRAYINVDAGLARVILFDAFYSCFLVYMDFSPPPTHHALPFFLLDSLLSPVILFDGKKLS